MAFYDPKKVNLSTREVAGRSVPVIVAPRLEHKGFLSNLFAGMGSLFSGMRVTLATFIRPSRIVTQQYPENRATLKMAERYRAQLRLCRDDEGRHLCTCCRACEKACPNGSIRIETAKGAVTGKNELQNFVWRFDSCTFCNLCVFTCSFDALRMTGEFEHAVFDRRLLVFNLNDYAGPHAALWDKVESEEDRAKLKRPMKPYDGEVMLSGTEFAGAPSRLAKKEARDAG